jgi:hypothetical protein
MNIRVWAALVAGALSLWLNGFAAAQNYTCPTQAVGDSQQLCASTEFVQQNIGSPTNMSTALDNAFGSTRGSILERGSAGWVIRTPGTSGFPWVSNGAGADPGYQALTAAGIAAATITSTQIASGTITGGNIASATVANSNLANMAAGTVKCNSTSSNGPPQDCNYPLYNVRDPAFGAIPDGTTDNTTAIQNATTAAIAAHGCVYFPGATLPYLTGQITGASLACWLGDAPNLTIIKLKNGANTGIFTAGTTGTEAADVTVANLTLDGNRANNTGGITLNVYGPRPRFQNININNSGGIGITTSLNTSDGDLTDSIEGFFENIRLDSISQTGWDCHGPNDSYFGKIAIFDAGIATDNTYYAFRANAAGGTTTLCNGRFIDYHSFSRDGTTNTPISTQIDTTGNNFVHSHFESGHTPLVVAGANNRIDGAAYGTRGTFAASVTGSGNILDLEVGLNAASANPNYKCLNLAGSLNIIRLTSGICNNGIIDFTSDGGLNQITITTFNGASIVNEFVGTPAANDFVIIQASGTSPKQYTQLPGHPAFTGGGPAPTLSSCGTSPSIIGSDASGIIGTGTGATACTLTFGIAYVNAPFCVVSAQAKASNLDYSRSTTALTLSAASASAFYHYHCLAQSGG